MPRPIYRWKSFWLGVLVLCFLGWAWADSMEKDSGVGFVVAGCPMGPASREATVALSWVDQIVSFGSHWRVVDHYRLPTTTPSAFPPPSYTIIDSGAPSLIHRVRIPYWLVMIVCLSAWGVFMAWRWRRVSRLTEVPIEGE